MITTDQSHSRLTENEITIEEIVLSDRWVLRIWKGGKLVDELPFQELTQVDWPDWVLSHPIEEGGVSIGTFGRRVQYALALETALEETENRTFARSLQIHTDKVVINF